MPANADATRTWRQVTGEHPDKRALAGPVGTQQTKHLTAPDFDIERMKGYEGLVSFADTAGADGWRRRGILGTSGRSDRHAGACKEGHIGRALVVKFRRVLCRLEPLGV